MEPPLGEMYKNLFVVPLVSLTAPEVTVLISCEEAEVPE